MFVDELQVFSRIGPGDALMDILKEIPGLTDSELVSIRDACDATLSARSLTRIPSLDGATAADVLARVEMEMEAAGVGVRRGRSTNGRNRAPAVRAIEFLQRRIQILSLSKLEGDRLIGLLVRSEASRIQDQGRQASSNEMWESLSKGWAALDRCFPGYPDEFLADILKTPRRQNEDRHGVRRQEIVR